MRNGHVIMIAALLMCLCARLALGGWAAPVNITNYNTREVGPRIAADTHGNVHMVWYGGSDPDDGGHWKVFYQSHADGAWSAPLAISGSGAGEPDIAVDVNNDLHVVWHQGNPAEIFYRKRTGATWGSIQQLTYTSGKGLGPTISVDRMGNHILVVWHEDYRPTTDFEIAAIKCTAGTWGTIENASQDETLSRNAEVAVDGSGNFHVVWEDPAANHAYYRQRSVAGAWGTRVSLDDSSGRSYGPDVAVDSIGRVHAAWHEDTNGWEIYYRSSDGSNWSTHLNLSNNPAVTDCCVRLDTDSSNDVHLAWHDYDHIYFRRQAGGVWQPTYHISSDSDQYDPHLALAPNDQCHVVWGMFNITPTGTRDVMWSWRDIHTTTDPVTEFSAKGANQHISMAWRNPSNKDLVGTTIRFKTTGYPSGPGDGALVLDRQTAAGSNDSHLHTGLANGVTYYYSVYAYNDGLHHATAAHAATAPAGPGDHDRDGDVDQADFGLFQVCLDDSFVSPRGGCEASDLDDDDDVDRNDVAVFMTCMSGANIPADPSCAGP